MLLLIAFAASVSATPAVVQHDLAIEIDPNRGHIKVVDRIRMPDKLAGNQRTVDFYLNAAFSPTLQDTSAKLERMDNNHERLRRYRVHLGDTRALTLMYSGTLTQPDGAYDLGHLGNEGVYLTAASAWYPQFGNALVTFSAEIRAPQGWTAISQGMSAAPGSTPDEPQVWRETRPQTEIILLAGRFTEYSQMENGLDARVYLRRPDAELAKRYLQVTARYVNMYARLLGPYPYEKFALVENFWETGYGMPSLAVLGPRVIRFPFILHSSYPHEILHNWWGNGVYVDPRSGNWVEGLTAYLADHLVQEQRGRGADYRRAALQKYASYVDAEDDFPLSVFRGKHGEVSQAVGYNKALMFFHMLRKRLGDQTFLEGLRLFAKQHWFQLAGYRDLENAFQSASGESLSIDFDQWIMRTGAPSLRLSDVSVVQEAEKYRIDGVIEQRQPGTAYALRVPAAVQLEGRANAARELISIQKKRQPFSIELSSRPTAFHLDPEFDVFRRLMPGEAPASVGDLMGDKNSLFVLPASVSSDTKAAYRGFARALGGGEILDDTASLPATENVWLLGWDNAHLDTLSEPLAEEGVVIAAEGLQRGDQIYTRRGNCVVTVLRNASEVARHVGFIGCDNPAALPGLARKVPHYGKYGFLVFTGDAPTNLRKDEWPARDSPLSVVFDPENARFPPPLPPRPALE